MLCIDLKSRILSCKKPTGGISDVAFFDPNDFNLVQALVDGYPGPYTAIAARTGATGQLIFPVTFNDDEGEATVDQDETNGSSDYTHKVTLQLPKRNQSLTNFLQRIDDAIYCCGLGIIIRYNSGEVFIAGEKYVNGSAIPKFKMRQKGSSGSSGKARNDLNGYTLVVQGSYDRELYEYSGTWASLEAFMAVTPTSYNNSFTYSNSADQTGATGSEQVGKNANGVNTTSPGTATANASTKFEFDTVTPRTGTPASMNIYLGSVSQTNLALVVSFTTDYLTKPFRFTDKNGVVHNSVNGFVNGNVIF